MKELSQLKPGREGAPARPAIFESSLTHIKYKYQGDESSTNLIAFNDLGGYAINKNGGVFTGPVQIKTATANIFNLTSSNGILTINLGFGRFFRVNLKENIEYIDVINVPTDVATTFTLIVTQENNYSQPFYFIKFRPYNNKIFKIYENNFIPNPAFGAIDNQGYALLAPFFSAKDIVNFKTIDSDTLFLSVSGLDYTGGGYFIYGTFIRTEPLSIFIENVEYPNGTIDIIANGTGGETYGNHNYPPNYPEAGHALFRTDDLLVYGDFFPPEYILDFADYSSTLIKIGDVLTVSDGAGGYQQVNSYYAYGTLIDEKNIYADIDIYGNKMKVGRRTYLWNGSGGVTLINTYDYVDGQVLPGVGSLGFVPTLAEDQWYDWVTWKNETGVGGDTTPYNTMSGGTYAVISNGDFTVRFEYSYVEEGTVYGYWPRYVGSIYVEYSDDRRYDSNYYKKLFVPSKLVADGNGKYRMETLLSDGAWIPMFPTLWNYFSLFDNLNYSLYGYYPNNVGMSDSNVFYQRISCGTCIPYSLQSSNTPACYSYQFESNCYNTSAYALRASYSSTGWSSNTAPPLGQGYFNSAVIRDKTVDEYGAIVADYDFIANPENRSWELLTFNPYYI
jgi:hypothetical protein